MFSVGIDISRLNVMLMNGMPKNIEREILQELVAGQNVKQIAIQLGTSPNTVRNQRGSILEKMAANSMADLVRMVLEAE